MCHSCMGTRGHQLLAELYIDVACISRATMAVEHFVFRRVLRSVLTTKKDSCERHFTRENLERHFRETTSRGKKSERLL